MDLTMLKKDSIQALIQLVRRMFLEIHTCIPGEIIAFEAETQLATVKSCIRNIVIDENNRKDFIEPPEIVNVPVIFLQSQKSGFSFTYPVRAGDQCLLFFSERAYDSWLKLGSVQNPAIIGPPLAHQYNDAFALVGIAPLVSSIEDFDLDSMELRNKDRSVRFSLNDNSIVIHNNKVEVILNKDNFITKLNDEEGNPKAFISIDKDGNINIEGNIVNVTGNTINAKGSEVNITGNTGNIIFNPEDGTGLLNITCPNIIVTGDLLLDGELYAKTYMVGPSPYEKVGVIAGNDERIERDNIWDKPGT